MTDAGSAMWHESLPGLLELHVDSAGLTDAGVATLGKMSGLIYLNLYHTLVTEKAYRELKAALPDCQIVWDRESSMPNRRGS